MFILTNLNISNKINIKIKEEENKASFITKVDNFKIVGKEKKVNCNLFVLEIENIVNDNETVLNLKYLKKARLLECEIVYETGIVQNDFNRTDLIKSFGSKKNIERLKNIETDGYLKNPTRRINNRSQILPKIHSSSNLLEIFTLEDMFGLGILEGFHNIDFEEIEILDESKRFYDGTLKNRLRVLLLDSLLKLLNFKFVTEDVLENSPYSCITPLFKEEIENRRLPKISRDKIIVKVYILILQIKNGKVKLASVPSFNQKMEIVIDYFKLIGCIYNKNSDEIRFVGKSMEYSSRFI